VTHIAFLLDQRGNLMVSIKFVDGKRLQEVICNFRLSQNLTITFYTTMSDL